MIYFLFFILLSELAFMMDQPVMDTSQFLFKDHLPTIEVSLKLYLKDQLADCFLYAIDGSVFKVHKAIFGQTDFQRKILSCAKEQCCEILEIICPLSKDELCHLVSFLYTGKIKCDSKEDSLKIIDNLNNVFGYSSQNVIMDDSNSYGSENESHIGDVEINEEFQRDPNLEKNTSEIESLTIKEELIESGSNSNSEKILNQFEINLKQEIAQGKLSDYSHTINLSYEKEYFLETERRFKDITNDQNDSYCVDRTAVKIENMDELSNDKFNDAPKYISENESVIIGSLLLQKVPDIPFAEIISNRKMESTSARRDELVDNVLEDADDVRDDQSENFENLKEVPENISCNSDANRVVIINLRKSNFKKRKLNTRDPEIIESIAENFEKKKLDKKSKSKKISSVVANSMTTLMEQTLAEPKRNSKKRKLNKRDPDRSENISENVENKQLDKKGQSKKISSPNSMTKLVKHNLAQTR